MEKSARPFTGMVSADDLNRHDRVDGDHADRFRVIDEMRAAFPGVSTEEIELEAARALAEVREEIRHEAQDSATCP